MADWLSVVLDDAVPTGSATPEDTLVVVATFAEAMLLEVPELEACVALSELRTYVGSYFMPRWLVRLAVVLLDGRAGRDAIRRAGMRRGLTDPEWRAAMMTVLEVAPWPRPALLKFIESTCGVEKAKRRARPGHGS